MRRLRTGSSSMRRIHAVARSSLIAPAWELAGLGLLLAFYLLGDALFGDQGVAFLNLSGPFWLTAVLALGALRMVLLDASAIWTALFWFRISTGVYFGAGALVPLLASAETRQYLEAYFLFSGEQIAEVNLIVAAGCVLVLVTANVFQAIIGDGRPKLQSGRRYAQTGASGNETLAAGLLFLFLGSTIKYLFVVPYAFGLIDYTLPGAISALSNFDYAAVFFLTVWSRERARGAFPIVAAYVLFDMMIGVLMLAKTEVMTVLMVFLLAFLRRRMTVRRLGIVAAVVVFCFMALVPIVDQGRAELASRIQGGTLSDRLEILSDVIGGRTSYRRATDVQEAAVRISYVNQATFAVSQYDMGNPGNSFSTVLAVFIPRFLWPDKPIVTDIGVQFNFAATGGATSASSPGLFAEAYWNFGWPGVVLLMIPLGIILAVLSRYALNIVHRELWLYFPAILLAMRIGFRTDGYFVADVVGGTVILVSLHLVLSLLDRFVLGMLRYPVTSRA